MARSSVHLALLSKCRHDDVGYIYMTLLTLGTVNIEYVHGLQCVITIEVFTNSLDLGDCHVSQIYVHLYLRSAQRLSSRMASILQNRIGTCQNRFYTVLYVVFTSLNLIIC